MHNCRFLWAADQTIAIDFFSEGSFSLVQHLQTLKKSFRKKNVFPTSFFAFSSAVLCSRTCATYCCAYSTTRSASAFSISCWAPQSGNSSACDQGDYPTIVSGYLSFFCILKSYMFVPQAGAHPIQANPWPQESGQVPALSLHVRSGWAQKGINRCVLNELN